MENWKDIKGYEGLYQVSDMGRIRSIKRKAPKILVQSTSQDGYFKVSLYDLDRKQKVYFVHRLIAEAFIENPDNKPTVDHINMDKKDNRICNLRWATNAEQNEYKGGKEFPRSDNVRKKVKNMETGEIFNTSVEAAHWVVDNDLTNSTTIGYIANRIRLAAQGDVYGRKTAFGHNWRFIEDKGGMVK